MGKSVAKAVVRADNRKLAGDLRKSRKMFGKAFGRIGKGVKGTLGAALSPLGAGVGALGFAAIGQEVLQFEQTLLDLEIQAGASKETMGDLRGTIDGLSKTNAIGKDQLAALAMEMVNLEGQAGLNAEKLKVLADAAFATSAPVEELAGLSLALGNAFNLVDASQMRRGLDGIITAGKEGSIPLNEMNLLLQQNGASFAKFSKGGEAGALKMAATLQALRKDAGSAGEAGTRLSAILGVFQTREVELGKAGIKVRDKATGQYRELADIIADIDQSGLVNNARKFNKAFGTRKEARLALDSLMKRKDIIDDITVAQQKTGTIEADAAKRRESDAFRIKKAFNDIKLTIAEAFTPERIKKFASAMEGVAKFVGFIADNIESFVALLVSIKISQLVGGFQAMAASSGVMTKNMGKMSGLMGKIGTAANLAGAAIAGWQIGTALDQAFGLSDKLSDWAAAPSKQEKRLVNSGNLRELSGKVQSGRTQLGIQNAPPEVRKAVEDMFGAQKDVDQGKLATRAMRLAQSAEMNGLIGKDGKVDKSKAFMAQTGNKLWGHAGDGANGDATLESSGTNDLVAAIQQGMQIRKVRDEALEKNMNFKIFVDEQGLLKAKLIEARQERRAPQ